ncbi:hypothetical protein [Massilia cavernae]|uniref:Uncharacterized protein n=1 Tax=Massilia cavernae TaxID=2320864 RepID=A0A418XQ56_9BURK|nr:hypothetical protein [Massilia cavernae]RJG14561.1 hypothetical protein D3872_17455 [Massilia cavernae]
MLKKILIASLYLISAGASASASLTELEVRWLKAAAPVLSYSRSINLPVDIIVQPKARPGDVPLAMGFKDGRCKLVLSMRGNPDAKSVLANVPEADQQLLIEAMAAHEVGHCWRYAQGVWHTLPAGFTEVGEEHADDAALLAESKSLRENRREEGYADLVALAWTKHHHPKEYARVYGWLESVRGQNPEVRTSHDTWAWVRLAKDASVFDAAASPFDSVRDTWSRGLLADE